MSAPSSSEIPIDPTLRKQAQKVLGGLGLDLNSAVRVFLKKVVATKSIPFALAEEPPPYQFSPAEEQEILASVKEGRDRKKTSGPFDNPDDLIRHLRKAKA